MEQNGKNDVPLLLTTQQASRYLAGVNVFDKKHMDTKRFLQFAEAKGLKPVLERETPCERRGGEKFIYTARRWSKRQIDALLA